MMTEQDKIDLSKRVAEKLGMPVRPAYEWPLYQDPARCLELAVEHRLLVASTEKMALAATYLPSKKLHQVEEEYADHPTKIEAACVAILRALEAE